MTTETGTTKKPRISRKPKPTWHLVTNHQNMLYMLAAGMVMGPAGFRGKHYDDPSSVYPGWIPLFRDKIPADALAQATSERKHLYPCIASFNLSELSGPVWILSRDGRLRAAAMPAARKRADDIAMLIRAPLPLTLLSGINFRTSEDRHAFESAAQDVSNVDLSAQRVEVAESLFSTDTGVAWPMPKAQAQQLESSSDEWPALGQALGGVLAMLYRAANRSDLGLSIFRLATGAEFDSNAELVTSDALLAELPGWSNGDEVSGQADVPAKLYWGVVQSLIAAQTQDRPLPPVEVALDYLENQRAQLREEKFQLRLQRLIADMRGCLGLGGGTITDLFEHHKGSLSRSLLLFCLRERCTDLLEFSHPLLSDVEYLLASILFGVRDSWLQLPSALRGPALSAYVMYRMADAEHRKQDDGLTLSPLPRPIPLRELFTLPNGEWDKTMQDAALEIARKCNWNDCIQTRITLTEGDFPGSFERHGMEIILPGEVTTVTEVNKVIFLRQLGLWPTITAQVESEIRKKLEKPKNGKKRKG